MKNAAIPGAAVCLLLLFLALYPSSALAGDAKPGSKTMPDGRVISADWDKTGLGDLPEPKDFT